MVFPFVQQLAVDLVRQHDEVVRRRDFRDRLEIGLRQHAAGRVCRAVDDEELRLRRHQAAQLLDIEGEVVLLAQRNRHGFRAGELDHRAIDGETGIGIDRLVTGIQQRQHQEEHDRLAARGHEDLVG